jgi:hypothetical protein
MSYSCPFLPWIPRKIRAILRASSNVTRSMLTVPRLPPVRVAGQQQIPEMILTEGPDPSRTAHLPAALPDTPRLDRLGDGVTCQKCRVPMKELKGHIFHKQRKWKCPKCARIRMQRSS